MCSHDSLQLQFSENVFHIQAKLVSYKEISLTKSILNQIESRLVNRVESIWGISGDIQP